MISCCSQPKLCHGWAGTEGEASPALFFRRCWLCQTLALAVTITSQVTGGSGGHCLGQCFCYGTCKLGTLGPWVASELVCGLLGFKNILVLLP